MKYLNNSKSPRNVTPEDIKDMDVRPHGRNRALLMTDEGAEFIRIRKTAIQCERFIKKAEAERLGEVPNGVNIFKRKAGAVTRYVLSGPSTLLDALLS